MDYFDLVKQFDGNLSNAFKKTKTKFFIMSFTSDWLYPTQENKDIVIALNAIGANVGFVEIDSDKGHDSFLLEVPDFLNALKNFFDKSKFWNMFSMNPKLIQQIKSTNCNKNFSRHPNDNHWNIKHPFPQPASAGLSERCR